MRRRTWLIVTALTMTACALFTSLDDLTGDAAVDAPNDSSDASTNDAGLCASLHGPAMVFVPTSSGGFCIDSTEVTTTDYGEFVAAVAKGTAVVSPPSGVCAWNTSVAPSTQGGVCIADTNDPIAHPKRPVTCVDWCDAFAYCAWAGKRMCGALDGGVLPFGSAIGASNQAFIACSANGTKTYPYGSTYVKGNCNTRDLYEGGTPAVADIEGFAKCSGGYPGIFDIAGNVEEWIDSCAESAEGGANDVCHESGDCFDYTPMANGPARCDNDDGDFRSKTNWDIGIRCCSP